MPIYKKEDTLEYCINSLMQQTYKDLEIILVDDGSPDRCPELCDSFSIKDKRIIVVHQCNRGVSAARNIGLQIAKGKYITFVDADDEVCENYIEQMLKNIEKNNILVTSNHFESGNNLRVLTSEEAIDQMFKNDNFGVNVWGKLFKREIVLEHQFLPGVKIGEDLYWLYNVLENTNKIVVLDRCLYRQKKSKYNSSCNMPFEKVYDSVVLVEKIIEHRKKCNLPALQSIEMALMKRCLGLFMRCSYDEIPNEKIDEMKKYVCQYIKKYGFRELGIKYILASLLCLINAKLYSRIMYRKK